MPTIDIYSWLEDFDNEELDHDAWIEQLQEAVEKYNEEYKTSFDPKHTVYNYVNRVINKPGMGVVSFRDGEFKTSDPQLAEALKSSSNNKANKPI